MPRSNITATTQSDAMQREYRAGCQYRRRGHVIEERNTELGWVPYFTGEQTVTVPDDEGNPKRVKAPCVNAAKRKVRELGGAGTVYVES